MPSIKISRSRFLQAGAHMAADGSDSITFQIYEKLKALRGADGGDCTKLNSLYTGGYESSGEKVWWKVEFFGEAVQDCGGAFRESVSNISEDLMSGSYLGGQLVGSNTPLFIPVRNLETDVGSLRDTFVPNPSCTNFEVYEWVGRLCAAAILSKESIVLRL